MAYLVIAIMLSLQILVCSSLSNFEFRAFAGGKSGGGGDGDGNRYYGPINNADSSERVIYCTFNENIKAPL